MGGKTSTTTQQVQIPQEVLDRYNAVNAQAQSVAANPFQIYSNDPSKFVAQLNQQQLTGIGNVNTAAGAYQPYLSEATDATRSGMASVMPGQLEIDKYMNPYQQQVIDATMKQMGQANEQAQSGALGTAISSGAFGGDRAGIAAANLANQQGLSMGSTLAGLNAQNYSQALQTAQQQQGLGLGAEQANLARLLSGGQQMAGLGQAAQAMGLQGAEAQINAGTLGQQTEQAGLSALYNQFQQQQAYPFQVAQFLANIAMGTGALSGSTTTTTQPGSFWSDRRLKHDIKRIGKTDEGMPIYTFKYKGDDSEQTHIGFMADEVEKRHPEAVTTEPSGYKSVDYDRATKAGGGGVAGPYGSMVGSQPGLGGYVPQAYLPVGDLMVADSDGLNNARMSMAQQLEAAAKIGESIKSLDEDWQWAKDRWGNKEREGLVGEAEAARGVAPNWRGGVVGYASGGPAYLEGGVKPNQNPVEKEGYLSDTVKGQEEGKKNQIMQPGSAPGQQASGASQLGGLLGGAGAAMQGFAAIAPFLGISDRRMKHSIRRIGKTDDGMPIYRFKYKGDENEQTHIGFMADEVERKHPDAVMTGSDGMKRVDYAQAHKFYQGGLVRPGYAPGGAPETEEEIIRRRLLESDVPQATTLGSLPDARVTPAVEDERTVGEYIADITAPARYAVTDRLPNSAMALGSLGLAGVQGAAGLGLGAINQSEASDYMIDAARNSLRRSARFDRASNAPMPENLTSEEVRALNAPLSPEQIAAREAGSNMTMEPSRSNGVLPSEYGRLLMNPAGSLPVGVSDPMRFAVGDARVGAEASPMRFAAGDARMGAEASPMRFAAGDSRMDTDINPMRFSLGDARMGAEASPMRFAVGDSRMVVPPGLAPASSLRPQARPAPAGLAAASTTSTAAPAAAPAAAPIAFTGVAGAGAGYTDVILPDGTVERREGARNWRNNNPGNIEFGPFAEANGAIGSDGRFAVFPTYEAGRAAKEALLFSTDGYAGKTIAGALERYAPRADNNNTDAYIATVANALGVDPNTPLADLNPTQREAMLTAMERVEGGGAGNERNFGTYKTYEGGVSPAAAPADRRGLAAGVSASGKPYDERNALGQIMYDPETNKLSRNALLSLASGVGSMLASPSQFFLPSVGLGLQGAASTFAGLEKQAADIGLTKAQELSTRIGADASRFISLQNGQVMVNLGPGRAPVRLQEFLRNPQAFTTGDPAMDAQIMEAARKAAAAGGSGMPTGEPASSSVGIFATPMVQDYISQEGQIYDLIKAGEETETMLATSGAQASEARAAVPSLLMQADAVSALVSDDAVIRAGALAEMQVKAVRIANAFLSAASRATGTDFGQIAPEDGPAAAQILQKAATETGMRNATGIQELQAILSAQPGSELDADANAELMAGLMISSRRAIDRDEFLRQYQLDPNNVTQTTTRGDIAFQEAYERRYLQEKSVLKDVLRYGSEVPEAWAAQGITRSPMDYLMDPNLSADEKNRVLMSVLTDEQIAAIADENGQIDMAYYFGG